MSWGYVAVAAGTVVAGYMNSQATKDAAEQAASQQSGAADAGILERRRQFDALQELLKPYAQGGAKAFGAQQDLVGLNGNDAQSAAIQAIQSSPQFSAMLKQGENSILQNASATGGLRGGNTQAALAQFSPALLTQLINDQYNKLGGIASVGQNAAAMTGNAGMAMGNNVSQLMQQTGAANAGAALASGRANAQLANTFASAVGGYFGSRTPSTTGSTGAGATDWGWTGMSKGTF